jgi:hypothetical protein
LLALREENARLRDLIMEESKRLESQGEPHHARLVAPAARSAGLNGALRDESVALEDPTDSAYCGRTVESNPWLSIRVEMVQK